MTARFSIEPEPRSFSIAHDPVCARCGHGESLHALSAGCLVCEQRASAGLTSNFCSGYLADSLDRRRVETSARSYRR
jgi:hypothetical protein